MKQLKHLFLIMVVIFSAVTGVHAFAPVIWTISSGASTSTIQSTINGASAGDTISFSAATYSVGSGLTGKCGITYTGPAISISQYVAGDGRTYWGYYGQTAILSSTFGTAGAILNFFNGSPWTNKCSTPTTIQYLSFMNSGGIYMQASYENVAIQYDNFGNIPGDGGANPASTGIYLDGGNQSSNTAQTFSNITIQWNRIGDVNSCLGPANAYADDSSSDGDGNAGGCNGTIINSSINGVYYYHNNFLHVSEGTHINCPGGGNPGIGSSPCEPSENGATTRNLVVEFNDFSQTHRMDWEEQLQTTSGVVIQYNSLHDKLDTPPFSFGLSMACCIVGTTPPYLNVSSNVIAWNLPPTSGRYGYGIEAWGNQATYSNNWLGISSNYGAAQAITWGWDGAAPSEGLYSVSNNTVCNGNSWAGQQYSGKEVGNSLTPTVQTGNNFTTAACVPVTSVAPTISPAGGSFSGSQTVTFTDAGYSSGPQPLGNTSIWYTTDGSTPVAGTHGTYIVSGGTITVSSTTTVKAVGMWGAQNQTTSYGSGLGFVPSGVVSQTFTLSGGGTPTASTPTFSPGTEGFSVSASVTLADSTPGATIHFTTDGSTPTTSSAVYTGPITVTANTTINALAVASGYLNSAVGTASYTLVAPTLTGATISLTGGGTSMALGSTIQACVNLSYVSPTENTTICGSGTDAYGNTPGGTWVSFGSGLITSSSSGLLNAIAVGSSTIEATVGTFTPTLSVAVTSTPPTFASVSVSLAGGGMSMNTGTTGQACANFFYTSPTVTTQVCGSGTDTYGMAVSAFLSSVTGVASITSPAGVITPVAPGTTNLSASVTGANVFSGVTTQNNVASTSQNTYEADYVIVGPNGLSPQTLSIYVGSGTSGKHIDLGITQATSPTTQATTPLCFGSITESGLTNQLLTATPSSCPALAPGATVWVWMNTDDPALNVGKHTCALVGGCTGTPTSPDYGDCAATVTYGTYTFPSGFSSCPGDVQRTQYFTSLPMSPPFPLNVVTPIVPSHLIIQHSILNNVKVSP